MVRPDLHNLRDQVSRGLDDASQAVAEERRAERSRNSGRGESSDSSYIRALVVVLCLAGLVAIGAAIFNNEDRGRSQPANRLVNQNQDNPPTPRSSDTAAERNHPSPTVHGDTPELPDRLSEPVARFTLKNGHSNQVSFAFFSASDSTRQWAGGQLSPNSVSSNNLGCIPGEKICFGAWSPDSNLGPFWGAGRNGQKRCVGCCLTCPAYAPRVVELRTSEAAFNPPTITFTFQNNHYATAALAFYSQLRPHVWPSSEQAYVLPSAQKQSFTLTCNFGEMICYGAWVKDNPRAGGWGVGFRRNRGCSTCCYECNGSETSTIALNP